MYTRNLKNLYSQKNIIIHVKPKKPKGKVPQSINAYFIIYLCIFGLDFGLKKTLKKSLQVILTFVQLSASIFMCVLLNYSSSFINSEYSLSVLCTFQYLTHHVLLIFSKNNVYDLIIDVHTFNKNIMKAVNTKFSYVVYCYTITTFGLKQVLCVFSCSESTKFCDSVFPGSWYCIPLIGLDGVTIIQMILCYHVYRSVRYIKKSLDNFDTKTVEELYCVVVNYCDKIRPLNSAFVSVFILYY